MQNSETKSWECHVDEEGILTFPEELSELLGWSEGDDLEFIDQNDGTFLIVKVNEDFNSEGQISSEVVC
jgi:AbrB family looped-hinge helix DNA binding protein